MVATTAVAATTVEAATTTVEPTSTTTAVEPTAASASVTAAVLGKGGHGRANKYERSDTCEKSLQQGGLPHFNNLYRTAVLLPREGKPPLTNRTSNWSLVPSRKLPNGERNQGVWALGGKMI